MIWVRLFDTLSWSVNRLPANWIGCGWLFGPYCWLAARACEQESLDELRQAGLWPVVAAKS